MKANTELQGGGAISSSAVVRPTIWQELKWNWWRGPIHKAIVWYLRRAGGAFHTYPYGPSGRYVVLMNENQYHHYEKNRRHWPNDEVSHAR